MNQEKTPKETYVRVKDKAGNEFICPIDALTNVDEATEEQLDECVDNGVDNGVTGRFAGNIPIQDS